MSAQQHIRGFHIAMDNAVTMRTSQAFRRLDHTIHRFGNAHRTLSQPIFERSAIHILHHDIGNVLLLPKIMNLHNVGMGQFRHRTRLLREPLHENGIARKIGG